MNLKKEIIALLILSTHCALFSMSVELTVINRNDFAIVLLAQPKVETSETPDFNEPKVVRTFVQTLGTVPARTLKKITVPLTQTIQTVSGYKRITYTPGQDIRVHGTVPLVHEGLITTIQLAPGGRFIIAPPSMPIKQR